MSANFMLFLIVLLTISDLILRHLTLHWCLNLCDSHLKDHDFFFQIWFQRVKLSERATSSKFLIFKHAFIDTWVFLAEVLSTYRSRCSQQKHGFETIQFYVTSGALRTQVVRS